MLAPLLIVAIQAIAQSAARDSQKAFFTMRINLKDGTVKPGSEVQVMVELTNTSAGNISLWRSRTGPSPYTIRVVDPAGKALATRDAIRNGKAGLGSDNKPPRAVVGTGSSVTIAPDETKKDAVSIEDQFDLSQPGAYEIQFERIDPSTKLVVKSNIVTLTIAN
jgi:hypothetical protein